MSITIPGLRRDRRAPRHKAADEVARLRHQLQGAGFLIAGLRQQVTDARAAEDRANAKATRYDEAEARAAEAQQAMAEQDEELTALRQFKANVLSVSDLDVLQAPDAPASTAARFDSGPVLRAGKRPVPAWAPESAGETTQSIPVAQLRTEVTS